MAATDQEVIDFYNSVSITLNANAIVYYAILNNRADVVANVKSKMTISLNSEYYIALIEHFDQKLFDVLIETPEELNQLYITALQSSRANYEIIRAIVLTRDPTFTFPRIMNFIIDFSSDIETDIDYYSAFPEFADIDWEQAVDDVLVDRPNYSRLDKLQRAKDKGRTKPKPNKPLRLDGDKVRLR